MDIEVAAIKTVNAAFVPEILDYRPNAERPFIVMEYIPGCTVDDLIKAHAPLSQHQLLRLAVKLAELLDAIHTVGVAHGDFRGQNLIVDGRGTCAVDFGRAALLADSPDEYHRRRLTDLLMLGVIIARGATGRQPFGEEPYQVIERYDEGSRDLGAMSGNLRTIAHALLSADAHHRPSARHIHQQLIKGVAL